MADQQANSSLSPDKARPVSSFLHSPRFFNGFFSTKTLDSEPSPSPTSILDLHGNSVNNPFEISKYLAKPTKILKEIKHPSEKFDHEGIALALVEEPNDVVKPNAVSRKVLFGSNLKIQIPPSVLSSPGSPQSPGDYGIKTRSSQVSGGLTGLTPTGVGSGRNLTGRLSWSEMELSEEYTRVVCHGPNPKTTHIYDNCVVESCCGGVGSPEPEFEKPGPKSPCESFLSLCHTCNKNLEEDSVIFIYRGEKAFCSEECRCEEMVLDGLIDVK